MAVAGHIGSGDTLEKKRIVIRKERFFQDVVGDLQIDPVIDMEGLMDKRQRSAQQNQNRNKNKSGRSF